MKTNKKDIIFKTSLGIPKDEFKYILVNSFDENSLKNFYEKFIELDNDSNVKVIPIIIDSYGGQVFSLLGMIDIIKSTNKPIATVALGKAMSCGSVLLSAGTKGYRYAGENCSILIHEVSSAERGKTTDIQTGAAQTKKLNIKLMRMLAENSGQKDKDFFLKMNKNNSNVDLYFTSAEAKSVGLIDFVSVPKFIKG